MSFSTSSGCPNSEPTLENLKDALSEMNVEIEPSLEDVDPAVFDRPFLGSPSIVVNGIDLYTLTRPDAFEFACRTFDVDGKKTEVLPVGFIRDRLQKLLIDGADGARG